MSHKLYCLFSGCYDTCRNVGRHLSRYSLLFGSWTCFLYDCGFAAHCAIPDTTSISGANSIQNPGGIADLAQNSSSRQLGSALLTKVQRLGGPHSSQRNKCIIELLPKGRASNKTYQLTGNAVERQNTSEQPPRLDEGPDEGLRLHRVWHFDQTPSWW